MLTEMTYAFSMLLRKLTVIRMKSVFQSIPYNDSAGSAGSANATL